jgi:broad specificity phosphatase PhoE
LTVAVAARLLLIRHAQSVWNAEGRWQGWADPPLSAAGESAALAAGGDPLLDDAAAIVASDLQRARRTAELLSERRAWPPVATYRGLRERGAGAWTGLTRAEIERRWPDRLHAGIAVIPGGESPEAVTARAVATLHRIAGEWPGTAVVVVTHGALIRLVEAHCGAGPEHIPNLAGRWFEVGAGAIDLGDAAALATTAGARR